MLKIAALWLGAIALVFMILAPFMGLDLQTPAQQVFWGMTVMMLAMITTVIAASLGSKKPSPKPIIDKFSKPRMEAESLAVIDRLDRELGLGKYRR